MFCTTRPKRVRSYSFVLLLLLLSPSPTLAQSAQNVAAPSACTGDSPSAVPGNRATRQSRAGTTGILTVRVVGLETNDGSVQIALTDAEGARTDDDLYEAVLPITKNGACWTIEDVPYGTYAVQLYHDKNDNGKLDTNLFGVPQEPYGFSNNARGTMGPPDFEATAFTLDRDSLSLTITAE